MSDLEAKAQEARQGLEERLEMIQQFEATSAFFRQGAAGDAPWTNQQELLDQVRIDITFPAPVADHPAADLVRQLLVMMVHHRLPGFVEALLAAQRHQVELALAASE